MFEEDQNGEPIPSGTGFVTKDCSPTDLLGWSGILQEWHAKLDTRPKGLVELVRQGVPEPLRGEVWQLLCNAQQSPDLMQQYPLLLVESAQSEQVILRDVNRTYPAHENFQTNTTNSLLDSLFKVCKAYAVFDKEVSYCQGLSFLVAALLLHMPEEQAFSVFVRIMQDYGLRNLFRNNFDVLHLKFYQLDHLLEDQIPDLYAHFLRLGIEPFMYASQWFLTIFTAKFPLNAVFYIMDIFLLDGINTIFQVSLALLKLSKKDLIQLDFEGVLKYFRVQMPKRYINQECVQELMKTVSEISLKRLAKHAKSFDIEKQREKLNESQVARLQREKQKLTENNIRLEQENDDVARQLVSSKIQLRSQLDTLEDKNESLNLVLMNTQRDCKHYLNTISDMDDEKARLEVEVNQLKEVCRRELKCAETKLARNELIIKDYKKICSTMSNRNEFILQSIAKFVYSVKKKLSDEYKCDESILKLFDNESENLVAQIEQQQHKVSNDAPEEEEEVGKEEKVEQKVQRKKDDDDKTLETLSVSGLGKEIAAIPTSNINKSSTPNNDETSSTSTTISQSDEDSRNKSLTSSTSLSNDSTFRLSPSSSKRIGAYLYSVDSHSNKSDKEKIIQLKQHVNELELELAKTKVMLVESECKNQQLTHDLNSGALIKQASSKATSSARARLDSVKAAATRRMLSIVNADIL